MPYDKESRWVENDEVLPQDCCQCGRYGLNVELRNGLCEMCAAENADAENLLFAKQQFMKAICNATLKYPRVLDDFIFGIMEERLCRIGKEEDFWDIIKLIEWRMKQEEIE